MMEYVWEGAHLPSTSEEAKKQVHTLWGDWFLSATHRDPETKAGKTVDSTLA